MGILNSLKRLVHGEEEPAFAVPEGSMALPIDTLDDRIAKKIGADALVSISSRPVRIKRSSDGKTVDSTQYQGFPVSCDGKPFGILPADILGGLLVRHETVTVRARKDGDAVVALVPGEPWFEAAAAGIDDLPSDIQVIRAYFSDKEWNGMGPGVHALEPLEVELIGGAHDAAGGQLMNFYTGDRQLVGTLPNKSYSFQKLRRKYPDHILAATAEELAEDHRGSRHCINVFVS